MAISPFRLVFLPRHIHARQATLHIAHDSVHHIAGSYQTRTRSGPLPWDVNRRRTGKWSPRKPGRMPHAIGARPGSLTPSIHPKLGVTSRHQGLHRCALHRIFRPYLEKSALTRILRRRRYDSIFYMNIQGPFLIPQGNFQKIQKLYPILSQLYRVFATGSSGIFRKNMEQFPLFPENGWGMYIHFSPGGNIHCL